MKFHNALKALKKQQEVEAFFMDGDCTLEWALNRCSEDLNQKRLAVVSLASQISAAETKVDNMKERADQEMRAINHEEKEIMDQMNAQIAKIQKEFEKKLEDIQQRKIKMTNKRPMDEIENDQTDFFHSTNDDEEDDHSTTTMTTAQSTRKKADS